MGLAVHGLSASTIRDPYREPGEKEPDPLPKKTPLYRKIWNWLTEKWSKILLVVFFAFGVVLLISLFALLGQSLHNDFIVKPRNQAIWVEQHRNTCEVVPRNNSAKFSLIIYDENANEFIEGFYDSRAEADTVKNSLSQCQK
jgi:hypothetical protein